MYLLGLGFWFWTSMILGALGILLAFSVFLAQILLVVRYGEKIRQIIINLPEYSPLWGGFINLKKKIKIYDIVGVVFYAIQIQSAVFSRKPSPNISRFREVLPKKIMNNLRYIKYVGLASLAMIFISGGMTYVQQHGWGI